MNRLRVVVVACIAASVCCSSAWADPWQRHTIDDSSRGADGVKLADVNGDGWPDVATGWEEGGVIRVYVNPGPVKAKDPWPRVTVGQVKSPEDAVFVDLDGDGATDVVSCCEGRTRTMFIHWAPRDRNRLLDSAAWETDAIACTENARMWMFATPMQVDDRNGVDLVVGSKGENASIGWLRAPADPRKVADWTYHEFTPAGWIMSLQTHDMDGDGDLDILASDRKGARRGVLWIENTGHAPGDNGKPWAVHRIGGADREIMFLARGRLQSNRKPDVLAAVAPRSLLLLSPVERSDEWQSTEIEFPDGCGTAKGVAIGDIDLDGAADVVFSCENAIKELSGVRWLSRTRASNWQDHEISGPTGVKFDRIELLDLDDDGDLDVLTCEERDNLGVIWYENPQRP